MRRTQNTIPIPEMTLTVAVGRIVGMASQVATCVERIPIEENDLVMAERCAERLLEAVRLAKVLRAAQERG